MKARCLTTTFVGVVVFGLSTVCARADVNDKVKAMTSPKDSKEFAMKAAEGGTLEVKLAQLAQQKASSPEVKQLAQKLEQDHTQANNKLTAIAKQKNIDLPSDLKGECEETYQAFQKLEGKDFDDAYTLHMITDHIHDIAMFQKEARNGTDQDIKQFASETLPTLREHASHVNTVARAIGIPTDALASGMNREEGARPAGSRIPGSSSSGTNDTATPRNGTTPERR